jgi:predicted Zn finger-like uncharacterized protein
LILTCPECATRYFVDDCQIEAAGRSVECDQCGAIWMASRVASPEQPIETDAGGANMSPASSVRVQGWRYRDRNVGFHRAPMRASYWKWGGAIFNNKSRGLVNLAWASLHRTAARRRHQTPRLLVSLSVVLAAMMVIWIAQARAHAPAADHTGAILTSADVGLSSGPNGLLGLSAFAPSAPDMTPASFRALTPAQAVLVNASVPFSQLPNPGALPFSLRGADSGDHAKALDCLTMAVYYEAASESADGQAAVAQVVLNRLRNPVFPHSVCGVVFQGSNLPTGCQFTFACDGSLNHRPSPGAWKRASQIAERALDGYVMKQVGEATHYHTQWVVPYWQPTVVKLTQIGAHIFYRWAGEMGSPGAFRVQYAGLELAPSQTNDAALANLTQVATAVVTAAIPAMAITKEVDIKPPIVPARTEVVTNMVAAPQILISRAQAAPTMAVDGTHRIDHNQRLPLPSNW